jgi:hypothetical protein
MPTRAASYSRQCLSKGQISSFHSSAAGDAADEPLGHGINPFDNLKDLFTGLSAAKITQINEFTTAAWAKAKARDKALAQAA